jgi:hypothetical protein
VRGGGAAIRLLPFLWALAGCAKLAVYEPSSVKSRLWFDERIESEIVFVSENAAVTADGKIITDREITVDRLPEGFRLLNINGRYLLAADRGGRLLLFFPNGARKEFLFDEPIVAAATDGRTIALVSRGNVSRLFDVESAETIFSSREKPVMTISDKIASPIMSRNEAVFPTLDGKLLIVDRAARKTVGEFALSNESFFANLIFLGEFDGHIIAATANRFFSIGRNGVRHSRDVSVRFAAVFPSGLYTFLQDGTAQRLSPRLEAESSAKETYARFVAAAEYKGAIYAAEQSGYLVKFEDDLKKTTVYELPDAVRARIFAAKDRLYLNNKIIEWSGR